MSDRTCPLGEDCDLTVAWMAGQQEARDSFRARINQLEVQLGLARTDADAQRARAEAAEARVADWRSEYETSDNMHKLYERRCAELIVGRNALKSENARLREALEPFLRMEKSITTDVNSAHQGRGAAASGWMREDDGDMRRDLQAAFARARAALGKAKP